MAEKAAYLHGGPHDGEIRSVPDDMNELIVLKPSAPLYGDRTEAMHPEVISTQKGLYKASEANEAIFLWMGWSGQA